MASVNKVTLIGNIGADPETRYAPSGDCITNIRLATTETWKDKQGQKQEETEWHRVVFFKKLAEVAGQYLTKGAPVYIEGRIKTRKWQNKDGVDQYTTEIHASEMKMLGKREAGSEPKARDNAGEGRKQSTGGGSSSGDFEDDIPFLFNMNSICDTMGKPTALWRAKHGKGMLLMQANKADF
jgi:single-strand DNA-binding protein